MRILIIIPILFIFAFNSGISQHLNTPKELQKVIRDSEFEYKLFEERGLPTTIEEGPGDHYYVYRLKENNNYILRIYKLNDKANKYLSSGEKAFELHDFELARFNYNQVLEQYPDFSPAMTFMGQSYGLEGNYIKAREWYSKAIEANFLDYLAHWYLALTALELDKPGLAIQEITIAHILNRNNPEIFASLKSIYASQKLKFIEWDFEPEYKLKQKDTEIIVRHGPEWEIYALCKALWKYERKFKNRKEKGSADFGLAEERECLLNLLIQHTDKKGRIKARNKGINGLAKSVEMKMLNNFIFYENWLKADPLLAYTQPDEFFDEISKYLQQLHVK